MSSKQKKTNLVWIDLEMTGLDPDRCTILEVGTVITNSDLKIIATGPSIAVHQPKKILDTMEPWSKQHHGASGLTDACRASKISLKKAENIVLRLVKTYCAKNSAPLCGNSIWQDRRFIRRYMPRLDAYLHYRMIDVSAVKELVTRWYPNKFKRMKRKTEKHRALDDILESISELKHYRSNVFVK